MRVARPAGAEACTTIGFKGTTVTDLESRAGLQPGSGSFYRHFPSKKALFVAIVEREITKVGAGLDIDTTVLRRLMDDGKIPRRDPEALAVVLVNALTGFYFTTNFFTHMPGSVELDTMLSILVDLVVT